MNLFLLSWRLRNTWNLNFDFKFEVYPSHQDRKTNSTVCFLGEVMARQFFFEIYWPLNDTKKIRNTLILLVFAKFKALIDALEFNDPFRQNVENLCRFFVILWTVVRTSQTKSAKPHFCRQSVHIEMQGKLSVSQCTIYWHSILFWRKYVLLVSSKLSTF